ncbi:MAG: hypothetical protein MK212_04830 [Saprospiraceae bacterium]|nr:hypothetical protein [Saprospiraceae bacterium]
MKKTFTKIYFTTLLFFAIGSSSYAQQVVVSPRTGNPIQKTVINFNVLNQLPPTIQKIVKDNPQKYEIVYTTALMSQSQYNQLSTREKNFVNNNPHIYQVDPNATLPKVQLPTHLD